MSKRFLAILLVVVMVFSMFTVASAAGSVFSDVSADAWYADEVNWAYEKGIMDGTDTATFAPNGTLTRGMIVTVLWRLEGKPVVNYTMTFEDVAADQWYTEAVRWAASVGIVDGYSETAYGPNDTLNREQMATILWRYSKLNDIDVSADDADISGYTDFENVSDWAVEAMQWACSVGLINGVTDSTIDPAGAATRAQTAVILYRFHEEVIIPGGDASEEDSEDEAGTSSGSSGGSSSGGGGGGYRPPSVPETPHEHKYTYTSNNDGTHNGVCECGKDAIINETCGSWVEGSICEKCGYNKDAEPETPPEHGEHTYTYTSNDNGTHNGVCTNDVGVCTVYTIDNEACIYTNGVCPKCGYEHDHVYDDCTPNYNGTHNGVCTCGVTAENLECRFTGDICDDCGYNKAIIYISNAAELKAFRDAVNNGADYSGKTVKLTANIDLADVEWSPIGTESNPFSGTFDGDDKTISNLTITSGDYAGLFGYVSDATIKKVVLEDAKVSGGERIGALIGKITGNADISDCSVVGKSTVTGSDSNTGGLIGEIVNGTVKLSNLVNNAAVVNKKDSSSRAGGIVGQVTTNANVTITNCTNNGAVTTQNGYAGGIVSAYQSGTLTIDKCVNTGTLDGAYKGNMLGWYTSVRSITISTENNVFDVNAIGCVDISVSSSISLYGKTYFVNRAADLVGVSNTKQTFSEIFAEGQIGTAPKALWDKLIAFYAYANETNSNFAGYPNTYWRMFNQQVGYSDPDWNTYFNGYNAECEAGGKLTKEEFTSESWREKVVYLDPQYHEHDYTYTYAPNGDVTHNGICACGYKAITKVDCTIVDGVCKYCDYVAYIVVRDTDELQAALDAATDGTIIQLVEDVTYGEVYVGRPTKYNETVLECTSCDGGYTTNDAVEFKEHINDGNWHTTPRYTTTLNNVTIVGVEGAKIAGVVATSGHKYGDNVHDYVLDKDVSGSAYYNTLNIENLKFSGVAFTGKVDINTSDADSVYNGVTFEKCTFTTGGTDATNGAAIRYYNEANNGKVKNLTVDECDFTNCYQGVYVQNVNTVTVKDSEFDTTGHNAIALQGSDVDLKTVVITRNTFENIGDRVIRFNEIGADSTITIENNVATNSGDEDGELIKYTTKEDGATITLTNNTWNGYTDAQLISNNGIWMLPVVMSANADNFVTAMKAIPAGTSKITLVDANGKTGLVIAPAGENSTIAIFSKEGLLYLNTLSNNWRACFTNGTGATYSNYASQDGGKGVDYYYSSRWTIVLGADVDLNDNTIDPVKLWVGEGTGAPTFNGNNYTISNAKIVTDTTAQNEAGLFMADQCIVKNLKLDNIHVTGSNVGNSTAGVLSGSCNYPVSNITITNSSVTGGKYTGGVVGYGYCDVTNCTLDNVTVKGGYKMGGIIGYICASGENTGEVTANSLTGCTVDGLGDVNGDDLDDFAGGKSEYVAGYVVGNYNCNGDCTGNTVTNMNTSEHATANIGKIETGCTVTE